MTISNEAVEVAARAMFELEGDKWGEATDTAKDFSRRDARAALEAAEPSMTSGAKAQALEEAADLMINPFDYWGINQRKWLRARAVAERGEG